MSVEVNSLEPDKTYIKGLWSAGLIFGPKISENLKLAIVPPTLKKLVWHIDFGFCNVCCNFQTKHARVLKFHRWIPYGKIIDPFFFLLFWQILTSSYVPF